MQTSSNSHGFTIVELLIGISVMAILTNIVLNTFGDLYYSNITTSSLSNLDTYTRAAMRQIATDTSNATNFLDTAAVTTPLGPTTLNNTWSYDSDPSGQHGNVLIVGSYATNKTRNMVALTGVNCDPALATPMSDLTIYFVAKDQLSNQYNLYRRTVVNWMNSVPCIGSIPNIDTLQKTTCSNGVINALCARPDTVLLNNVSSFKLDFYAKPTDTATVTGAAIQNARTVKITATSSIKINGASKQSTTTIRINTLAAS